MIFKGLQQRREFSLRTASILCRSSLPNRIHHEFKHSGEYCGFLLLELPSGRRVCHGLLSSSAHVNPQTTTTMATVQGAEASTISTPTGTTATTEVFIRFCRRSQLESISTEEQSWFRVSGVSDGDECGSLSLFGEFNLLIYYWNCRLILLFLSFTVGILQGTL